MTIYMASGDFIVATFVDFAAYIVHSGIADIVRSVVTAFGVGCSHALIDDLLLRSLLRFEFCLDALGLLRRDAFRHKLLPDLLIGLAGSRLLLDIVYNFLVGQSRSHKGACHKQ